MYEMRRLLAAALRAEARAPESRHYPPEHDQRPLEYDQAASSPIARDRMFHNYLVLSDKHMVFAARARPMAATGSDVGSGCLLLTFAVVVGIGFLIFFYWDRVESYTSTLADFDWALIGEIAWVVVCSLGLIVGIVQLVRPRTRMRRYVANLAQTNFNLLWIIVIACLVLLHVIIFTFPIGPRTQILVTTILWGFFIGVNILFLLPSNLIITFFGVILGIGGSEIDSGAGLISSVRAGVSQIAAQVTDLATELGAEPDRYLLQMVWLFFAIVWILCFPAFFPAGVEALAKNLEEKKDS